MILLFATLFVAAALPFVLWPLLTGRVAEPIRHTFVRDPGERGEPPPDD